MIAYQRYIDAAILGVGLLAVTRIRFLPKEITAIEFIPFCWLVGGISGAFWGVLFHGERGFPKKESFRGAALGALFGILFIVLGASHA